MSKLKQTLLNDAVFLHNLYVYYHYLNCSSKIIYFADGCAICYIVWDYHQLFKRQFCY